MSRPSFFMVLTAIGLAVAVSWPVAWAQEVVPPDAEKALAATGNEQLGRRWEEGDRGLLLLELAAAARAGRRPITRPSLLLNLATEALVKLPLTGSVFGF